MAGEAGYPWTVMQKTKSQDEGGESDVGPWIVAWRWHVWGSVLVLSDRILGHLASTGDSNSIGLHMDAQLENPHLFKNKASAARMRDDVLKRVLKNPQRTSEFYCKVVTKEGLDRWKIEGKLEQIASESGNGASA